MLLYSKHRGVQAPVAQLDRVADFESEGWRFESSRARFVFIDDSGSQTVTSTVYFTIS